MGVRKPIDREACVIEAVRIARTGSNGSKVAGPLAQGWHMARYCDPFDALVPFLGPEEKDLVLLNGPADVITVVVPTELTLCTGGATSFKNGVICIELIVSAGIVDFAVELILPAFGYEVDSRAGHGTKLRAVSVALNFELLNG